MNMNANHYATQLELEQFFNKINRILDKIGHSIDIVNPRTVLFGPLEPSDREILKNARQNLQRCSRKLAKAELWLIIRPELMENINHRHRHSAFYDRVEQLRNKIESTLFDSLVINELILSTNPNRPSASQNQDFQYPNPEDLNRDDYDRKSPVLHIKNLLESLFSRLNQFIRQYQNTKKPQEKPQTVIPMMKLSQSPEQTNQQPIPTQA